MKTTVKKTYTGTLFTVFSLIIFCMIMMPIDASAHGGKPHSIAGVTTLEALDKALVLYKRLIDTEKLGEVWETQLMNVSIKTEGAGNVREITVQFTTDEKVPQSVFFFFDNEGSYTGSNFTGK